ncbi:hypothetical protein KFK09_014853 [Dendrobium nobile]|uniref:Uncharacterized protein n=1 Tax=Dendrobium nobile TaxID=94219 RepID=A0A8T3B2X3_DENNO|nr:hypothetical protein KFK09_014853 [Dendrobium nobile]
MFSQLRKIWKNQMNIVWLVIISFLEIVEGLDKEEYGPWMLVKYGKKKLYSNNQRKATQRADSKKIFVPMKRNDRREGENMVKENAVNLEIEKQQLIIREKEPGPAASEVLLTKNSLVLNDGNSFKALMDLEEEWEIVQITEKGAIDKEIKSINNDEDSANDDIRRGIESEFPGDGASVNNGSEGKEGYSQSTKRGFLNN